MDGGRVVLAMLSQKVSRTKALKITRILGVSISFCFILVFVNFTFLSLGLVLFFTAIWEDKTSLYERSHFLSNKNFSLKKGILIREIAVIEDTMLYKLVEKIRQDSITNFCVVNSNMETVGFLEEKQIEKLVEIYPATTTLKTILN